MARDLCGRIFEDFRNSVPIEVEAKSSSPSLTYSDKSTLRLLKKENRRNADIERGDDARIEEIGFRQPMLDEPDNENTSSESDIVPWHGAAGKDVEKNGSALPMPEYPPPSAPASSPTHGRRGPFGCFGKRGGGARKGGKSA